MENFTHEMVVADDALPGWDLTSGMQLECHNFEDFNLSQEALMFQDSLHSNTEYSPEMLFTDVTDLTPEDSGFIDYGMLEPVKQENVEAAAVALNTTTIPEEFPGIYNFDFEVASEMNPPYMYSRKLKKLFIMMGNIVPIKFKWNHIEPNLLIRALPLYVAENSRNIPVTRCPTHAIFSDPINKEFPYVDHVIRCEDINTMYLRDVASNNLNILIPSGGLQPGDDFVKLLFKFVCKTSCKEGMNRRPIQVLFSLERNTGEILGQRKMFVRVCSCPKRDMLREEALLDDNQGKKVKKRMPKNEKTTKKGTELTVAFETEAEWACMLYYGTLGKARRLNKPLSAKEQKLLAEWKQVIEKDP